MLVLVLKSEDSIMNTMIKTLRQHSRLAGKSLLLIVIGLLMPLGSISAGEVTSIKWEDDSSGVQIHMTGKSQYKITSLEGGQRQRVTFSDTTLGQGVDDLEGRGGVKGVYSYSADNNKSVNIDVVTEIPGNLDVSKTGYGYLVKPQSASVAGSASPASAAGVENTIIDISYNKLPGSRVQLRLTMEKRPTSPKAFTITNPARIALDFSNTKLNIPKDSLRVGVGALVSVKAIEVSDRTRIVLNLIRPVGYNTGIVGNALVLTLDSPVTEISGALDKRVTHFGGKKTARFTIQNIDFRRGPQGGAKLIVKLSDPSIGVDIKEQAGDIVLDFLNTSIPASLERRLDVVDFATPVQTIDVFTSGTKTRMVIAPIGKYEHLAYQAGNVFTLNVKPILEKAGEREKDEFGYSGEKLSLNFQNIQVRAALQVLADFTGLNFVMADTVSGELTLRLKDVPWDQALDLILDAKNLAMRKRGNVITVAPAQEVAAKEKAFFEAAKAAVELEPLTTELIQINYADADDIAKLLKSIKPIGGTAAHPVFGGRVSLTKDSTESNSLLSPRGQVTTDKRTNTILIQDTPGKIREIRILIAKLDQPVRQVLIESRLVEATDNFSKSIGARFGISGSSASGGNQINIGSGSIFPGTVNTGMNVNLPSGGIGTAPAGSIGLSIIKLASGDLLSLELNALEQEGKGKIISSPRILTANGEKAKIEQGQERVFTTNVLGVGTVVTKKAVLMLEVTPRITPDDRVIMDVLISKDNFADAREGILNIKKIETQVLLDNGETVVIGGIYELDRNRTDTKVPFFGDIPLLGWLFKNREIVDNKTELLIFLTPKIMSDVSSL